MIECGDTRAEAPYSERIEPWVIVGLAGHRGDGAIQNGNRETQQRKDIVLNVAAESTGKVEPVNTEASAASAHRDFNNKRNLGRIESEAGGPKPRRTYTRANSAPQ